MLLTTIFFHIDEFCKQYDKFISKKILKSKTTSKAGRPKTMHLSEVMTICVCFQRSGYQTFKRYYQDYVCVVMRKDFSNLINYNRFVERMKEAAIPLALFAASRNSKNITGISFIDSTKLTVCKNLRISSHKVFKGIANRGKSSTGWFYGFKLHIIINHLGEIINFWITSGNVDDKNPKLIDRITKNIYGLLLGDKGYVSQALFENLFNKGIKLITGIRKNMKNKLVELYEKLLLRKRNIIESTNNLLKNTFKIEHSRHRCLHNFLANAFAAITAYSYHENKPSIGSQLLDELSTLL